MKKLFVQFIAFIATVVLMAACNSNTPKATADKFLTALYHYDYETAKSLSTEDTKKMLDMIAQFSDAMPDSMKQEAKKIKVNIKDVQEQGDTAIVRYETSDEPAQKSIHLIKEKGTWLVQWSKMDAETGVEPETDAAPPAEQPVEPTPADGTEVDTATKMHSDTKESQ